MVRKNYWWLLSYFGGAAILWSGCSSLPDKLGNNTTAGLVPRGEASELNSSAPAPRSDLPAEASLVDYLRYAALNNPGLEAAFYRWKATLERVAQVTALPDPTLSYGYFVEQVETRVGPQRQRFGIAQTFPWFGKRTLRGKGAEAEVSRAYASYEQAKRQLFFEVTDAYVELFYLREAVQRTEESIELIMHLESVAQAKFRAGSDATGVIKAQVELGKLEDRLKTLVALRGPLSARLNSALNRDLNTLVSWPSKLPEVPDAIDDAEIHQQLLSQSPELLELDAKVRASDHSVGLARKAFYPDLTLGVDYVETRDARSLGTPGSGRDPVMIMGRVNLPLWKNKYRAGLREALATRDAAVKNREHQENVRVADLKMALYHFHDSKRKISLLGDTLMPLAQNSLDVAEQAYQAGRADFLQLIDAQRLLLDIQLSYQRALADCVQRFAEIERMVGVPLGAPADETRR